MKLTDFALIFIAILLPIVVIVYVNTAFVVKAEKQEMYYKNIMNSAVSDAVSSMKQVESENAEIDYGYSGIVDKKVSVNEKVAISTFYNSISNNFNIAGNEMSKERLKMYIPVIAVLDYDGIYIHSAEEDSDKNISFVTKPKVYYTYKYVIEKTTGVLYNENNTYTPVALDEIKDFTNVLDNYVYEITFTMDDYVYLNVYEIKQTVEPGTNSALTKPIFSKNFYLNDTENNDYLVYDALLTSQEQTTLIQDIVKHLQSKRRAIIGTIAMKEISYAVNKHNSYAAQAGITYNFTFSVESDATWYETMDGIGMIAIIQGISLGNRYLNYKAYSASDLIAAKKYYVSSAIEVKEDANIAYLGKKLYHSSVNCEAYKQYLNTTIQKISPSYYTSRAEAASHGFYPCPVCKP